MERSVSSSAIDNTGIDLDYVTSNLNRSVTLIGSNLAIFTFLLLFLFPRYASNQLNGVLFQATLTGSLLTIFLFGISGVLYFEVVAWRRRVSRQRCNWSGEGICFSW